MNILVIEDDDLKFRIIENFLESYSLERRRSYQSGLEALLDSQFDLLILDMTLPVYDVTEEESGFEHLVFAGEMVLSELKRRKIFQPTIVLTQYGSFFDDGAEISFADLASRLRRDYEGMLKDVIYLSSSDSEWQKQIKIHLK